MGFPRSDPFKGEQIRQGATTEKRRYDGWSQYGVSFPPPITCPPSSLSKSPMRGRPSVYPQDPIHGNSMKNVATTGKGRQRKNVATTACLYMGYLLSPHNLRSIFPVEVANARTKFGSLRSHRGAGRRAVIWRWPPGTRQFRVQLGRAARARTRQCGYSPRRRSIAMGRPRSQLTRSLDRRCSIAMGRPRSLDRRRSRSATSIATQTDPQCGYSPRRAY